MRRIQIIALIFLAAASALSLQARAQDSDDIGTLNGQVVRLYQAGKYAEAIIPAKKLVGLAEQKFGPDHPNVGGSLNNLALLYYAQGRYAEAEPLYKRTITIYEKALGPDHPNVGTTLNNLAGLYESQGRYAEAEPLYKRSLAISEKALGPDHPDVGQSLNNLAELYYVQDDWATAAQYFRRGTDLIVARTRRSTQTVGLRLTGQKTTEAGRASFGFGISIKAAHRLAVQKPTDAIQLASETFQTAQWALGSDAAASLAKMAARQATGDPQLAADVRERQDLVDEWQKRDAFRTAAASQPPNRRNRQQEAQNAARLADIDKRIAGIDTRLAADFPDYANLSNPAPLTITEVQEQLRANEALVLFLNTPEWEQTPSETFIWVVTKTASKWVRSDLTRKALADHVDALRCGLDFDGAWKGTRCFDLLNVVYTNEDRNKRKPLPFRLDRAHVLYDALFGQIGDLIAGKELLVVPSGPLTKLPFQTLVTEKPEQTSLTAHAFRKASWLAQKHAITVLPAVSSLVSLRQHAKASRAEKSFIGFGNPLLDGPDPSKLNELYARYYRERVQQAREFKACKEKSTWQRFASLIGQRNASDITRIDTNRITPAMIRRQTPLPETANELCEVADDAGAAPEDVYLGARATEASLKQLSADGDLARYRVLHFATHGALAGEITATSEPGLILTPPKSGQAGTGNDGYLSATEIAGLKLNADWVILSACNTAGGENQNAEALSGMARAFIYAGARSLLVSHWYVDSNATVSLITKAFAALRRDPQVGRAGALRQAMLVLIRDKDRRTWHPEYWAPFIVVGEGAVAR
ncbi:MAG: CHAT domain-containing tetratricopeptide repeat protein [Pseudomonadota bacterium]